MSLYDTLTQLPNRLLFQEKIEQSLKESKRKNNKNALLFIDLDNFKNVNDTYGHDVGDKLLIVVGQIKKGLIREEDTLARIGGDEFMIILEELNNAEDSAKISKKIIAALKEPIKVEKYKLYIGASIGISIFPDDSTNVTNLLKNADVAMYKAKEIGKNNFQFYSENMMQNIIKKTNLEITLKEAIKNQEFLVYFQPQVNAQNNTLTGMEALVRRNHPQKGLVSPIEFVPLAEEIGLISEIDSLVMKSAMSQYVKWHKEGFKPGKLALNLSVKMIEQENCISNLKEIVKETNFQFSWLSLEVTESHIMNIVKSLQEELKLVLSSLNTKEIEINT